MTGSNIVADVVVVLIFFRRLLLLRRFFFGFISVLKVFGSNVLNVIKSIYRLTSSFVLFRFLNSSHFQSNGSSSPYID